MCAGLENIWPNCDCHITIGPALCTPASTGVALTQKQGLGEADRNTLVSGAWISGAIMNHLTAEATVL